MQNSEPHRKHLTTAKQAPNIFAQAKTPPTFSYKNKIYHYIILHVTPNLQEEKCNDTLILNTIFETHHLDFPEVLVYN